MRQWAPGLRHVKAADRGAAVGSKTAAECPYLVHTGDKEIPVQKLSATAEPH